MLLADRQQLKFRESQLLGRQLSPGTLVMYNDGESWREGRVESCNATGAALVRYMCVYVCVCVCVCVWGGGLASYPGLLFAQPVEKPTRVSTAAQKSCEGSPGYKASASREGIFWSNSVICETQYTLYIFKASRFQ